MNEMSPAEIAWVAGIFEGEGHVRYQARGLQVRVGMSDRDVVDALGRFTGIGTIREMPRGRRIDGGLYKPMFIWGVSNRSDSSALLAAIYPWLGRRRRQQVDAALAAMPPVPLRTKRVYKPAPEQPCGVGGSYAGARRHRRNGELPCSSCRLAQREYFQRLRFEDAKKEREAS